jgi:hypothetical protein
MSILGTPRRYGPAELNTIAQENHSGIRTIDANTGRYETTELTSVIRQKYELGSSVTAAELFVSFSFSLNSPGVTPTHISVVNGDVSHGCIWELDETAIGRFSLNGVIKYPTESITIYLNLRGEGRIDFSIESLLVAEVRGERPLRLGFIIDPWIERNDPAWKADYLWWFGKMEQALRGSGRQLETCYVFSDVLDPFWDKHKPSHNTISSTIKSAELSEIYPEQIQGVRDQRVRLGRDEALSSKPLANMISKRFPWVPDVIISMSDMQILKDVYPDSLILYRDAVYCREPFQDELTSLDCEGLYKNSQISSYCEDYDTATCVSDEFIDKFYPHSEEIERLLNKNDINAGEFLLLPLQDSRHYNFYDECTFVDQAALVEAVATRFSSQKVIITQHPDHREISVAELSVLCSRHSNLVYLEELENVKNPTARLLRYASRLVGVSTGLIFQAVLCGIPVHFLGDHALRRLLEGVSDQGILRAVAFNFMTRVFSSYKYLHDGAWLSARMFALELKRDAVLSSSELMIDMPSNVFGNLVLGMRMPTVPPPPNREPIPKIQYAVQSGDHQFSTVTAPTKPHLRVAPHLSTQLSRRSEITKLMNPGSVGIELGVAEGVFSQQLLTTNIFSHLYSVDMYEGDRGHDIFQYSRAVQRLSFYRSINSLIRMRFEDAIELFEDQFFDFIYIDGYAHTGQENGGTLYDWYPKTKKGGIFAGHDYSDKFPLVVAEVDRFASRMKQKLYFIHDEETDSWNHGASTWFMIKE